MDPILMLVMALCVIALLASAFALGRAYVPPQQRTVLELRRRVEEVEEDHDALHARLNKRARQENVAQAREKKEQVRTVEEEAAALLSQGAFPQPPAAPTQLTKEQLRRRLM